MDSVEGTLSSLPHLTPSLLPVCPLLQLHTLLALPNSLGVPCLRAFARAPAPANNAMPPDNCRLFLKLHQLFPQLTWCRSPTHGKDFGLFRSLCCPQCPAQGLAHSGAFLTCLRNICHYCHSQAWNQMEFAPGAARTWGGLNPGPPCPSLSDQG